MIRRFLCNLTTTKLKVNYWGLLGISRDIIIILLGEQNISQPNSAFVSSSAQTKLKNLTKGELLCFLLSV